ncbi:MAG: cytochrome c biogenesis protein ResB [Planctomycetota bacterium]|jgi:hypothetical protein
MGKFLRFEMWTALILIALLTALSILGAFYGAERAALFFNSPPLVVFWLGLTGLLIAGLATFGRLIRVPGLLLIHLGPVLVLIGGMWGSEAGHRLQKRLFDIDKVPSGYMMIYEQTAARDVLAEDGTVLTELPFSIYLEDFRIEYYLSQSYLQVEKQGGGKWDIPAEIGRELVLDEAKITIVRTFRNFRIDIGQGRRTATDAPGQGNPAVEINIKLPDGTSRTEYIFSMFPAGAYSKEGLKFTYVAQQTSAIKDYFSDIVLRRGNEEIARKTVEVNHPLHYGGYHFYQNSYDAQNEQYTVLTVHSDNGLYLVYAGYLILSAGILWQMWLRHIPGYLKRRANGD